MKYFNRLIDNELNKWKLALEHKPILLRGARQVGKSSAVRNLAKQVAGKPLLFFDKIQACASAISRLRFFYEKMPELYVVAAGSLLEFALEELPSFGVGRIRSLFMYPFSFAEFLDANGNEGLRAAIKKASPANPLDEEAHKKAVYLLKLFMLTGGMSAVVAKYLCGGELYQC